MTRFNNVKVLLNTADNYNQDDIIELLLDEDTPVEYIAEDIAYVIISMWALVPADRKRDFKDRLTDDIVNLEIAQMFYDEEE